MSICLERSGSFPHRDKLDTLTRTFLMYDRKDKSLYFWDMRNDRIMEIDVDNKARRHSGAGLNIFMRFWIDLCETMEESDGFLYHTATKTELDGFIRYGVRPGSFWCNKEMAEYYAEFIRKEGGDPIIVRASISVFTQSMLAPNKAALKEPITKVIGKDVEEVQQEWAQSEKTWKACLDLVGSVRYRQTMHLPPAEIMT
jgi:hypothetical protein